MYTHKTMQIRKTLSDIPRATYYSLKLISLVVILLSITQLASFVMLLVSIYLIQGRIQDFKLGGALKKFAPSGGRREIFGGISCEKSRFYAKKSYSFQF